LRIEKSEPFDLGGNEQKLYPFLYQANGIRCKSLIEHPKLYRFLVTSDKARMNKGFRDWNGGHCQ